MTERCWEPGYVEKLHGRDGKRPEIVTECSVGIRCWRFEFALEQIELKHTSHAEEFIRMKVLVMAVAALQAPC
jgi:hypothetical protein